MVENEDEYALNVDDVEKILVKRILKGKSDGHKNGWNKADLIEGLIDPRKASEAMVNHAMELIGETGAGILIRQPLPGSHVYHRLDKRWSKYELRRYAEHPPGTFKD